MSRKFPGQFVRIDRRDVATHERRIVVSFARVPASLVLVITAHDQEAFKQEPMRQRARTTKQINYARNWPR